VGDVKVENWALLAPGYLFFSVAGWAASHTASNLSPNRTIESSSHFYGMVTSCNLSFFDDCQCSSRKTSPPPNLTIGRSPGTRCWQTRCCGQHCRNSRWFIGHHGGPRCHGERARLVAWLRNCSGHPF